MPMAASPRLPNTRVMALPPYALATTPSALAHLHPGPPPAWWQGISTRMPARKCANWSWARRNEPTAAGRLQRHRRQGLAQEAQVAVLSRTRLGAEPGGSGFR